MREETRTYHFQNDTLTEVWYGAVLCYDWRDAAGGEDGRGDGELNEEDTGYSPIFAKYTGSFFYQHPHFVSFLK